MVPLAVVGRRLRWFLALLPLLVAGSADALQLQLFLTGLSNPLYLTHSRDGTGRLFVVEQAGVVKVVQPGSTSPTVFLDITNLVLSGGERGLLGLAFHPQYSANGRLFVYYTRQPDGAIVIAEYARSPDNPDLAVSLPNGGVLLVIPHPGFGNHNGGMIEFGPDGFLYAGTGDGGSANDPPNNAQNIESLLGKILRIDVDSAPATSGAFLASLYANALGRTPGADELASWMEFLRANCNTAGVQAVVGGFFGSPEFAGRPLSVAGHVTTFYRTLLGRDPDPAGLAAWADVLRQARLQIALNGFIPSAEFRTQLPDRTNRTAVEAVLASFYREILGREPDAQGLASWVDFVVATGSLETAAAGFLASAEFEARPLSIPGYITILYRAFLGRDPEPAGLAAWQSVLQAAIVAIVQAGFVPAAEFNVAALCSQPYRIPDNPFVGVAGADEIYAYGLRNPFRFSFDRETSQLFVADVGQNAFEEIDIVTRRANMGWRVFEGFTCTGTDPGLCGNPTGFTPPIAVYDHSLGRCSVTGGYVYRGAAGVLPGGTYVFGDFCSGEILTIDSNQAPLPPLLTGLRISSFGEDEAGELYVVDLGGTVHRLVATP